MPVDEDENPYRIPKNRLHRFLKRLNVQYPNLGVISFVSAEEYKEYYDAVYKRNILRARYGEGMNFLWFTFNLQSAERIEEQKIAFKKLMEKREAKMVDYCEIGMFDHVMNGFLSFMTWCSYLRDVPSSLMSPFCTFLLNRYLGCYLLNKQINIEQLSVDIFAGKGSLKEVELDVKHINETLLERNIPVHLFDGFVKEITINVPWTTLLEDCCLVEIDVLESLMMSVTSSLELARSFVVEHNGKCSFDPENDDKLPFDVISPLVKLIDTFLSRMRFVITNVVCRLEHYYEDRWVALEARVGKLEVVDQLVLEKELSNKRASGVEEESSSWPEPKKDMPYKAISIFDVRLYTDSFLPVISMRSAIDSARRSCFVSATAEPNSPIVASNCATTSLYTSCVNANEESEMTTTTTTSSAASTVRVAAHQSGICKEPFMFACFASPTAAKFLVHLRNATCPDGERLTNGDCRIATVKGWIESLTVMIAPQRLKLLYHLLKGIFHCPQGDLKIGGYLKNGSKKPFDGAEFVVSDQDDWLAEETFYPMTGMPTTRAEDSYFDQEEDLVGTSTVELGRSSVLVEVGFCWIAITHDDFCDDVELDDDDDEHTVRQRIDDFFTCSRSVLFDYSKKIPVGLNSRSAFDSALPWDHLRLVVDSLKLETTFQANSRTELFELKFSCSNFELVESLQTDHQTSRFYTELLKFDHVEQQGQKIGKFQMTVKRKRGFRVSVELEPCSCEVDISMVNRIAALLSPLPRRRGCSSSSMTTSCSRQLFNRSEPLSLNANLFTNLPQGPFYDASAPMVTVKCANVTLKVRVPEPRPIGIELASLKEKRLRQEYFTIRLAEFCVKFVVENDFCNKGRIVVQFASLNGDFVDQFGIGHKVCKAKGGNDDDDNHAKLIAQWNGRFRTNSEIAQIETFNYDDHNHSGDDNDDPTTTTTTTNNNNTNDDDDDDDDTTPVAKSLQESLIRIRPAPSGSLNPFSKSRIAYEGEPLIVVGNAQELKSFRETACGNCQVNFQISIAQLCVAIDDKNLYELLFNRLFVDFSLWNCARFKQMMNRNSNNHIGMFSLLSLHDDDDDADLKQTNIFDNLGTRFNFDWSLQLNVSKLDIVLNSSSACGDSTATVKLHGDGVEWFATAGIDEAEHFASDAGYFYLNSQQLVISRLKSTIADQDQERQSVTDVDSDSFGDPSAFVVELEPTSRMMNLRCRGDGACFSVGAKILFDPTTESGRKLIIAFGLRDLTVQQVPAASVLSLKNFFDIRAFYVPGYTPPPLTTDFHLHLWNVSLEYRPPELGMTLLVNVNNADVSTSIDLGESLFRLNFIVEDSSLFLAPHGEGRLSIGEFVCLMKMGFFNVLLSISTDDSETEDQADRRAQYKLQARNDALHLYTCADSCAALLVIFRHLCVDTAVEDCTLGSDVVDDSSIDDGESAATRYEQISAMLESAMKEETKVAGGGGGGGNKEDERRTITTTTTAAAAAGEWEECGDDLLLSSSSMHTNDDAFTVLESILAKKKKKNSCLKKAKPTLNWLNGEQRIEVVDCHLKQPTDKTDPFLVLPEGYPMPVMEYLFRDLSVVWHVYAGSDFYGAFLTDARCPKRHCDGVSVPSGCFRSDDDCWSDGLQRRRPRPSELGDGLQRDRRVAVDFHLNKVTWLHQRFADPRLPQVSRQMIDVQDLEVIDKLPTSKVTKLFCGARLSRQSTRPMLSVRCLRALAGGSSSSSSSTECSLKVSLVPVRLSVDQETLEFLEQFFKLVLVDESLLEDRQLNRSASGCTDSNDASVVDHHRHHQHRRRRLMSKFNRQSSVSYFRSFTLSPSTSVKLEYFGKRHVDVERGALQGLLLGLSRLHCTELKLKELQNRHGMLGLDRVLAYVMNEWLRDIRNNQLMALVGSVEPLHNVAQIAGGIRDLLWLPVQSLRNEGRLLRGVQRGTASFAVSTASTILDLSEQFFVAIHTVAEFAFDVVSPDSCRQQRRHGLAETAHAVAAIGRDDRAQYGRNPIRDLLRQATPCVFGPVLVASRASHQLLGGLKNQIRPEQ
ncbi:Autophagy-related protein 2 -like protein B [Trichinella nativa]|uniref:Autophagy-related protein 2 n=1 Tax=Trichinella nativa TaxID=6335 RepID=A0A0V1L889_9BILA|nr:Autophagy-related protein 2 -like protein B [Trichinella nativa]